MDKSEASAAIGDIELSQKRIRARAHYKGADVIYALWGVLWFIAFSVQQYGHGKTFRFGPVSFEGAGIVWTPLVLFGIATTLFIARRSETIRDKTAHKLGLLWPVVFGYFYLWMYLLGPLLNYEQFQTEEGILHATAVVSTIPMCIYVLTGLMGRDGYIAWVGAIVTAMTLVGILFVHDYFYIWMAFFGGGGLLMAGYISNRKWKNA